jgi:protocatechuate 3,4-dioxygenase alpha subunit
LPSGLTPSQTVGPFFAFALPFERGPELVPETDPNAVRLEGQVIDGAGEPVPDALVELWHDDLFGRCATDPEGLYHFTIVKPPPGPASGGVQQAPHFNVTVFARGLLHHIETRMYFPGEAANASDPVLNLVSPPERRETLIARSEAGNLRFDIHLQGERETVFFDLSATSR